MTEWREDIETEFGGDVYQSGFSGQVLPSGSLIVDFLTGVGGFPCGAIIEIFGNEGSGKTTLALTTLKHALESGKKVLFLDYESTISDSYLRKLGINPRDFDDFRLMPTTMEDGFMVMRRFCERYTDGLIVTDSVAAMPPISDVKKMEEVIGQAKVGSQAQVMSVAMREMTRLFRQANHCVIFTNQERSKIDTIRGLGGKTTPGGAAVKFYSSLRLQMEIKPPALKEKVESPLTGKLVEQVVALNVEVRVVKNKLAPSYRRGSIVLRMDEGIDDLSSVLRIAEAVGLVKKRGAFYTLDEKYSGEVLGGFKAHGLERLRNYFLENTSERYTLVSDIKQFLSAQLKKGDEDGKTESAGKKTDRKPANKGTGSRKTSAV